MAEENSSARGDNFAGFGKKKTPTRYPLKLAKVNGIGKCNFLMRLLNKMQIPNTSVALGWIILVKCQYMWTADFTERTKVSIN